MTNKEAVEVLEDMKVTINIPKAAELQRKRNKAIDMAIETLSNSEIPNNSDMVYRQDAIDALDPLFESLPIKKIKALPPAQPEVIHCKDCKHWGKRGLCEKWDQYISNEDFFCGCAERRTDERHDIQG